MRKGAIKKIVLSGFGTAQNGLAALVAMKAEGVLARDQRESSAVTEMGRRREILENTCHSDGTKAANAVG